MNQFEASIEAVDHRPLAPRARNDEADVFAVVGCTVEERDAEAIVAAERRVRDGDRVVLGHHGLQKVCPRNLFVFRFDVDAQNLCSASPFGGVHKGTRATGRF